jgi:5-methyltetrahydrofolate--homocysteine methyltransferase
MRIRFIAWVSTPREEEIEMVDLSRIIESIIQGRPDEVRALTRKALDGGEDVRRILNQGLVEGMNVVGEAFRKDELFIPEVLMSAKAMKAGMEVIQPTLAKGEIKKLGRVVLGTAKGDLHDIGKNLVGMLLEGAGFDIVDVGVDVSTDRFLQEIRRSSPDVVAISALLTTTMPAMEEAIKAMETNHLREKVKIIVGGAPVTREFANEVGADGYAPDAVLAVAEVKAILKLK